MARNRMIKPDFWDDEKISQVSRDARLVFVALWNFSDDYGVVKGNHVWLKNNIFPYDDNLKLSEFKLWINELVDKKRIAPFDSNEERYYFIRNFNKHQTINRPSAQRNPEPPSDILEDSLSLHDMLTAEGKLKEGKLSKGKESTEYGEKNTHDILTEAKKNPSFFKITSEHQSELNDICFSLQSNKIFPDAIHFRNEMLDSGINPKTIIHAFERAAKKKTFDKIRGGVKAYCRKIINIEDGNFNEAESREQHEVKKSDTKIHSKIKSVIGSIGERV